MQLQWWVTEALVEYAIGSIVILLRIFARTKSVGVKGWQGDDYLIILGFLFFTAEAGLWYGISLATNLEIGPDGPTPAQLELMRESYKCNFIVWPTYVSFIWCLKGCILFFYSRLTFGLWQRKLVKIGAYMCVVTYVACILELFLHCLPLSLNWIVRPYPGAVCGSGMVNFYVVGSLNLITDGVLLCIPLPLMWRVRLPTRKKILLGVLLGSGVFIMLATLVRNILGLLSIQQGIGIKDKGFVISWALRENFVALLVVNIPCIYPLFNKSNSRSSWLGRNGHTCNSLKLHHHGRSESYDRTRSSMAFALDGGRAGNRSSIITATNNNSRSSAGDGRFVSSYHDQYAYSQHTPSPGEVDDFDSDDFEVDMPKRGASVSQRDRERNQSGFNSSGEGERLEIYTTKTVAVSGAFLEEISRNDDIEKGRTASNGGPGPTKL